MRAWPGVAGWLLACIVAPGVAADVTIDSERHRFRVETVVAGLEHPWSLAFLPDGAMLVTERPGRLRLVRDGALRPTPLAGVPAVADSGQGGLLDVAVDPDFDSDRTIYLSYAAPGRWGRAGTAVMAARLGPDGLEAGRVIFRAAPASRGGRHFGSRLAFDGEGRLYVTTGDRGDRPRAQDVRDPAGKVHRLERDGAVPADNPFRADAAAGTIFSYGHRNPQGLARHPATGVLWLHEHGPRGGDEVNILRPGANYGWPLVTHGRAYSGGKIGSGTTMPGVVDPVWTWVPSIAPSGMAFYDGAAFPGWQGNLFVGALAGRSLVRLTLDGDRVTGEERLLESGDRIRDVRVGPDGLLYLLTDSPGGRLLRLVPAG